MNKLQEIQNKLWNVVTWRNMVLCSIVYDYYMCEERIYVEHDIRNIDIMKAYRQGLCGV